MEEFMTVVQKIGFGFEELKQLASKLQSSEDYKDDITNRKSTQLGTLNLNWNAPNTG